VDDEDAAVAEGANELSELDDLQGAERSNTRLERLAPVHWLQARVGRDDLAGGFGGEPFNDSGHQKFLVAGED
jgi:hypothetical protein